MQTDSISDMLARIRNGYMANLKTISMPWSNARDNLANVLVKNGYLSSCEKIEVGGKNNLVLTLRYVEGAPVVSSIKRVSRPSLRVYVKHAEIRSVLGGNGISVISTPKGLMTNRQARKAGFGGEVWCEIY